MIVKLMESKPAKIEEIKETERQLGCVFPQDYHEFLLKYNGSVPESNVFRNDLIVSVDSFIPVAEIGPISMEIEGFPFDAFPIAEVPSGNFVYLRKNSFDVFFWDHEIEKEKKLASSFTEFLEGLRVFDDNSIQLKPGQVKSVWVDPDFKPEF
jgi:hypothetical protein